DGDLSPSLGGAGAPGLSADPVAAGDGPERNAGGGAAAAARRRDVGRVRDRLSAAEYAGDAPLRSLLPGLRDGLEVPDVSRDAGTDLADQLSHDRLLLPGEPGSRLHALGVQSDRLD